MNRIIKNRIIKIGSRDSALAVIQAQIVMDAVKKTNPAIDFELVRYKTTGDKILDKSLDSIGGKGLFIKELEQALADGSIDIAIHSYKDMTFGFFIGHILVAVNGYVNAAVREG